MPQGVLLEKKKKNINVEFLILNKLNKCLKGRSETLLLEKTNLLPLKFIQPTLLIYFLGGPVAIKPLLK